jgi:hypothetical protein
MGQPAREREAHHSADDEGREFIVAAFSAAKALGFSRPHCRIVHLIAGCFNKGGSCKIVDEEHKL